MCDVLRRELEHLTREVDGGDVARVVPAAEFNRDQRRAGADVEHIDGGTLWPGPKPGVGCRPQEVIDEGAVDLAVVHRVVVARLLRRVHHLRLENAWDHGGLATTRDAPGSVFHGNAPWLESRTLG